MNHSVAHKTPPVRNFYGFSIMRGCRPRGGLQKTGLVITITAHMNEIHVGKKLGGDKIALLGLFAVALLTARFLVVSRSAILLSEPIQLSQAGLAVSMPMGNGWQCEKQWTYSGDIFTLNSFFIVDPRKTTAWARCQFRRTALQIAPQRRFEHQAFEFGGEVVETGQMSAGSVIIDWARIDHPEIPVSIILGSSQLPGGRQLDIEVYQVTGDTGMAGRVFERIVGSLQFKENQGLNQDVI